MFYKPLKYKEIRGETLNKAPPIGLPTDINFTQERDGLVGQCFSLPLNAHFLGELGRPCTQMLNIAFQGIVRQLRRTSCKPEHLC